MVIDMGGRGAKSGIIHTDDTIREMPVIEIASLIWNVPEFPYIYTIYDEEWLEDA